MASLDHEGYCAALDAEMGRLLTSVAGADLTAQVPTCPDWTLGDLLRHIGTTHRWCDHIVREGVTHLLRSADLGIVTPGDRQVTDWLAEGAARLLATLRAAGPDLPVWAWGADHRTRTWSRRMFFETLIHRADADFTLGRLPGIDPATAADGIDEFFAIVPQIPWVTPKLEKLYGDPPDSVHLHASDTPGEWTITLGPNTLVWSHGHAKGTAAVQAPAESLLFLLYGRTHQDAADVTTFGDRALLDRWLAASAF